LSATFLSSLPTTLELPSTPSVPLNGACPDPVEGLVRKSSPHLAISLPAYFLFSKPFPYLVTALLPCFLFLKSFSCNTYGSSRKCCKQKTYRLTKPFRCNTYKKHGALFDIRMFRCADAGMFGTRGHLRT